MYAYQEIDNISHRNPYHIDDLAHDLVTSLLI